MKAGFREHKNISLYEALPVNIFHRSVLIARVLFFDFCSLKTVWVIAWRRKPSFLKKNPDVRKKLFLVTKASPQRQQKKLNRGFSFLLKE